MVNVKEVLPLFPRMREFRLIAQASEESSFIAEKRTECTRVRRNKSLTRVQ